MKFIHLMFSTRWSLRIIASLLVVSTLGVAVQPTLASFSLATANTTLPKTEFAARPASTITGNVFQDYNANGAKDNGVAPNLAIDRGLANVSVTAYISGTVSAVGSTTTDANGNYTLITNDGGSGPYRVEFSLPSGYFAGPVSPTAGATVQFVNAGGTANLSIIKPSEYCQNNPSLATSCYVPAKNVSPGPNSSADVLISFPYTASGNPGSPSPSHIARADQIGTTWGLAYSRSSKAIFAASYMKRHTGFGPSGPGAIYVIQAGADGLLGTGDDAISPFTTLDAGTDPHPLTNESMIQPPLNWFRDQNSFDKVGKLGLGDLDISDDDGTLFVINLFDRSLYEIAIAGSVNAPTAGTITSVPVPTNLPNSGPNALPAGAGSNQHQTCAAGDVRPFATGYHNGQLYVGMVCSAQSTQASDLRAYVYSYDPATNAFASAPVLEFPLTYSHGTIAYAVTPSNADWTPWFDDFYGLVFGTSSTCGGSNSVAARRPQPMLADIVFDQGSMVLGFRDRTADQTGCAAGGTKSDDFSFYTGFDSGDILRACPNGTGWTVENNAQCGSVTGGGAGNNQGPGGGEFYVDDTVLVHDESSWGGLVQVPGFPSVAQTMQDPFGAPGNPPQDVYTGGIQWLSNSTGQMTNRYQVYNNPPSTSSLGKAGGLGDLESLCEAAPLEIGNRIWRDQNSNGVQDPGEPGINGVSVRLFDSNGSLIATTTTDSNGNYVFSTAGPDRVPGNGDDLSNFGLDGIANTADDAALAGLKPSSNGVVNTYQIRLDSASNFAPGGPLENLAITTPFADGTTNGANRDSNASNLLNPVGSPAGNWPVVNVQTGTAGINDHSYDVGFVFVPPVAAIGDRVWFDSNANGTQDLGEQGVPNVAIKLFNSNNVEVDSTTTNGTGNYGFIVPPGNYYVQFVLPSGFLFSTRDQGNDDAIDSDPNPINGNTAITTLTAGETDNTWDAGLYQNVSLGNRVWYDANNNGQQDVGEPSISSVSLALFRDVNNDNVPDSGVPFDSITTGADGSYVFSNLTPGTYLVAVAGANFAPGGSLFGSLPTLGGDDPDTNASNTDSNGRSLMTLAGNTGVFAPSVTLSSQAEPLNDGLSGSNNLDSNGNGTVDFGFYGPSAIGNYVWLDEDSDGYQDAGEPGIPNVRVVLTYAGLDNLLSTGDDETFSTYTDAHGGYLFPNLKPGNYRVDVDNASLPAGLTQTVNPVNTGADFGSQSDPYFILGLPMGIENLTADFGYNYKQPFEVTGNTGLAAIGDRVWFDADGDGKQDLDEVGIPNVVVQLITAGPDNLFGTPDDLVSPSTATTDATGYYIFNDLPAGAYRVRIPTPPAGYSQTGDPDHFAASGGTNDNQTTVPVVLAPGDVFINADFGYQPVSSSELGAIGDTVWLDANADSVQDVGEPGISGVTVALIRDTNNNGTWDPGEPIIATDTTDANGSYLFPGLPVTDGVGTDDYLVWINDTNNVVDGLAPTYDVDGINTPRISASYNLAASGDLSQDFGFTPPNHGPTDGLIGDTIWLDTNNNGVQDNNEFGLEGIIVTIQSSNGALYTTTTDENGHYYVGNLPAGTYTVTVTPPSGLTQTYDSNGLGTPNQSTVTIGGPNPLVNLNQDFGYVGNGRIGNLVWLDSDADGIFTTVNGPDGLFNTDDDEPVIGGVTVDLYRDINGNGRVDPGDPLMGTTTTSAAIDVGQFSTDGNYIFRGLPTDFGGGDADYVVNVTDLNGVLVGYWHSHGSAGVNNNSQIDPFAVTLTPTVDGSTYYNADFGYYVEPAAVGNFVWDDQDHDGLQDPSQPAIPNMPVRLTITWPNNTVTQLLTRTAADGSYSFGNLLLDEQMNGVGFGEPTFVITPLPLAGFTPTLANVGGNADPYDFIDSDGSSVPALPKQGLTNVALSNMTGVNASYDFGFYSQPTAVELSTFTAQSRTISLWMILILMIGLGVFVAVRRLRVAK